MNRTRPSASIVGLAVLAGMAMASPAGAPSLRQAPVTLRTTAAPVMTDIADEGARLSRLNSLIVSWRGDRLLERYFRGTRADRPANVKSASKSVVSALVGIAIERRLIAGVDEPLEKFFPELLARETDVRKRQITIEDLLTMRSGLETTSNRNYGAWVRSANWVRYVLRQPLVSDPGTTMEYSTGSTHLLSAIITRTSKKTTLAFAREALAKPLGVTLAPWPTDPQGIYFGGNEMLLTPRQMLAFGELYLNRGRVGDRQVVPEAWVDTSLTRRTVSRRRSDRFYGYGWWSRDLADRAVYYAWGYGGQFIFIVPSLDLAVVTTSSTAGGEERRDHLDAIYDLVERLIIPRVDEASRARPQPGLPS